MTMTSPATILHEALQRRDPDERAAYLNEACGDNDSLRAEVERLLAAHEAAGEFLNEPTVTVVQTGPRQPFISEGPEKKKCQEPIDAGHGCPTPSTGWGRVDKLAVQPLELRRLYYPSAPPRASSNAESRQARGEH